MENINENVNVESNVNTNVLKAIRLKCLDCCCDSANEVKDKTQAKKIERTNINISINIYSL